MELKNNISRNILQTDATCGNVRPVMT